MNIADPQSFNRYAYVGNDPLNFVDPSGLEESWNCFVDGMPVSCASAFGLLSSGAGVIGPLNMQQFNYQTGMYEYFHAYADGFSGWIPQGASYAGDGTVLHNFAGFDEGAFDLQRDHSVSPFLEFGGERNFAHGGGGGAGGNRALRTQKHKQQQDFNDCAKKAWRRYRWKYLDTSFTAIAGGAFLGVGIVM